MTQQPFKRRLLVCDELPGGPDVINGDLNKRTRRHCCISVSAYVGNKFVLQDRKRNKKMPQIKKTMRTMDLKQEHFHRLSSAPANGSP